MSYAKEECSEENLLFFTEVRAFRARHTTYGDEMPTESDMRRDAAVIIDRYLRQDAPDALNLPSAELMLFKDGLLDEHKCTPTMFDALVRAAPGSSMHSRLHAVSVRSVLIAAPQYGLACTVTNHL